MSEDIITSAAQHITRGDYMGAMSIFEEHVSSSPDDPAGYHGWAEADLLEIQENGNLDDYHYKEIVADLFLNKKATLK